MRILEIIQKKRDGIALTAQEIDFFVAQYTAGQIPDYQISALLMAIYFKGMDDEETVSLTQALVNSGETVSFAGYVRQVADKHSTGGVGDKTTLVLLPLAAAAGVNIAKMSGRGLGHTGGTIDKLSCIPGFNTDLDRDTFIRQVREIGLAITGQTPQMTPADGKLYALRDVTGTVDSIPLIASSVMSKKIAAGARNIILDVKTGSGAFMRDLDKARELARVMAAIGGALGRRTIALITAMEQPLGCAVGNHVEVAEAIETLRGHGPKDLTELCLALGAEMLIAAGITDSAGQARETLINHLQNGAALETFRRFIRAQGGDPSVADDPTKLGEPAHSTSVCAVTGGYLARLDARIVGLSAVLLGAGREKKGDSIDLLAGIRLHKKIGDYVAAGDRLAEVFCSSESKLEPAATQLCAAFGYAAGPPAPSPLIFGRIDSENL